MRNKPRKKISFAGGTRLPVAASGTTLTSSKSFFMRGRIIFILLAVLIAVALVFHFFGFSKNANSINDLTQNSCADIPPTPVKTDRIQEMPISDGATYGELMKHASTTYATAMEIYTAAQPEYDLIKIRAGRAIELTYDKDTDELKKLAYKIDSEDELNVEKICSTTARRLETDQPLSATTTEEENQNSPECDWQAKVSPIPYEVKIKTAEGTVESSMYQAALDNNIDIRAIIELANAFQWSIDFAMDPRAGDTFKFIYEERYLNGEYVMPGKVLAGQYINAGTKYQVYYFEETADNIGYFDENGNSVQKMFLKAPVEFRYISSGYTTGNRVVMEVGLSGPHRAIDYAAAMGTPIRAVGDGTVTFAGWNSHGYGNLTSIRHNATYSTNYAHQSKIIVRVGQKVKQGDVIGYVGSTGYSTGPHVHFEMVKNGVKINPLTEVLPPGKPIKEENKDRFFAAIKDYQEELNK